MSGAPFELKSESPEDIRLAFREYARKFQTIQPSRAKRIAEHDDACGLEFKGYKEKFSCMIADSDILKEIGGKDNRGNWNWTAKKRALLLSREYAVKEEMARRICDGSYNHHRGVDIKAFANKKLAGFSLAHRQKRYRKLIGTICIGKACL